MVFLPKSRAQTMAIRPLPNKHETTIILVQRTSIPDIKDIQTRCLKFPSLSVPKILKKKKSPLASKSLLCLLVVVLKLISM